MGVLTSDEELHAALTHLRRVARVMMRSERSDHTLQPTALVHEAWIKLAGDQDRTFDDHVHFCHVATAAMRQVLVDYARGRNRQRRNPDPEDRERLRGQSVVRQPEDDTLLLDQALDRLERRDPRLARIVELRVFCGLSVEETAFTLELSPTTVKREWRIAKSLLRQDLGS